MRSILIAIAWFGVGVGVTQIIADVLKSAHTISFADATHHVGPPPGALGDADIRLLR